MLSRSANILIRGIGPSLGTYGVTNPLADPTLLIFDGDGNLLKTSNDWGESDMSGLISQAVSQVGAFALDESSLDAAVIMEVQPGAYTATISSADETVGIVLIEIYLVD